MGATRDDALRALHTTSRSASRRRVRHVGGVSAQGVTDLAGTYSTDPTLRDICAEAYRLRDAERQGMIAFDTDILTEILMGAPEFVTRASSIN